MTKRIVVGYDGSPGGGRALAWAVEQADLSGARLDVVHAWHPPLVDAYAFTTSALDVGEIERAAHEVVEAAIEPYRGRVRLETHVVCASPASVLLEHARDADLLVVGSRGHGGFTGLLLGSVSQQVTHHAPCPVVVVPAAD